MRYYYRRLGGALGVRIQESLNSLDKALIKEIYCILSDNDPYITAFTAKEMSKRLGGKFILVKGAGHFTEKYGVTTIPKMIPYF